MSDQIHLLRHGIPTEIALAMAIIAVAVIAAVIYAVRRSEDGERILSLIHI